MHTYRNSECFQQSPVSTLNGVGILHLSHILLSLLLIPADTRFEDLTIASPGPLLHTIQVLLPFMPEVVRIAPPISDSARCV